MVRRMPAAAFSAIIGVQGMPDGGEDAFHMRAASRPETSTGQATIARERWPRWLQLAAPPARGQAATTAGS